MKNIPRLPTFTATLTRVLSNRGACIRPAVVALLLGFGMAAQAADWSAADTLATARDNHTATLLLSGKVLVAGGRSHLSGYLAAAELYTEPDAGRRRAARFVGTGILGNHRRPRRT